MSDEKPKRRKRRLLAILTGGVLILLAVSGWVYYHVYMSTGAAVQRAESLLFRRMQVTRVDDQGAYRFFFVTNRRQESNDGGDIETQFSNEREDELKFGYFDSTLESDLGLGIIFNPDLWFQTEQTRIRELDLIEIPEFIEKLTGFVQSAPRRSLLVVVHGFREEFPSALRKTAFLESLHDRTDLPVHVRDRTVVGTPGID